MKKTKSCGNCEYLINEDVNGNGWCIKLKKGTSCFYKIIGYCKKHKFKINEKL